MGEAPFCPYTGSLPDFYLGEEGENCLKGVIKGKMKEELRKKSTFHMSGVV